MFVNCLRLRNQVGISLICILCLAFCASAAQNQKPPLTNGDIVRMTREHLNEKIIIGAIETSETNFDVSVNGLIQLKRNKVHKKVIEAMQEAAAKKGSSELRRPINLPRTPPV